jgi:hypothetical protein
MERGVATTAWYAASVEAMAGLPEQEGWKREWENRPNLSNSTWNPDYTVEGRNPPEIGDAEHKAR